MLTIAITAVALMATACSGRQQEWETARRADTLEAYQNFLQSYPDGEFASQAQARVRELQETSDWQKAIQLDTADAYQQFLHQHPQGRWADEARIRLGNFALAQAPSNAPADATAQAGAALTAGLQLPTAKTTAAPASASASSGHADGYRIQLGAFSGGDKQAMGEWRRLQSQYPKLLNGLSPSVKLATTSAGHLYRLQAGILPEANARQVCATLKADNQPCIVVPP
jgi:hypothetical protein